MERVAVVAAVRTPIGRFLGAFADMTAADLGVAATEAALERAHGVASDIDELIYGCARQAGGGPNVARQVLIRSGIPQERPAFTVNQACGSGLQAIILAAEHIRAGKSRLMLAGGTESMSRVPYLLDRARTGYRLGNAAVVDGMYRDGFQDP
ncbi:MAG TPA: beta-ketoacyl synthase N-terminal-like domain-containing protein, partial [Candidatus Limnocylindrales bacterium]|nr:beta-ketoacyl synthase N-terminal-like domain-containing protein [Candidatus Limnocylindrales bacterium]